MCDKRKTAKLGPIQLLSVTVRFFLCPVCGDYFSREDNLKKHEMCSKGDQDGNLEKESSENLCSGEGKDSQVEQDDDELVSRVVNIESPLRSEQVIKTSSDAKGIQPGLKKLAMELKSRPRAFEGPLNEKAGTSASVVVGRKSTSSLRTGLSEGTVKIESPEEDILPGTTVDVEDEDVVKIYNYDCKLCDKAFGQLQGLRKHLEIVHEIGPAWASAIVMALRKSDVVPGKRIDRQKSSEEEHQLGRKRRKSPSVEIECLGTRQPASAEGTNRSSTQAHPSPHVTSLPFNNAAGGKRFNAGVRTTNPPTKDNRLPASVGARASAGRRNKCLSGSDKKHQCDQCPEVFRTPINLEDHMAMHRGERPYTCPKCGRAKWCRYEMSTHMKSAHRIVGAGVLAKRAANANP